MLKEMEERLRVYGRKNMLRPNESKMQETLQSAKQSFYESAVQKEVSYLDFVYEQSRYIRKRWWMLQFLVLFYTGWLLQETKEPAYMQRMLGVSASLFVIMMIPELWKNRSYNSVEIEGAARFSLRQIYTARMLTFAVVDTIFFSVFAGVITMTVSVSIVNMIVQFFLPMTVTCCICFRCLCSRYASSEYMACFLSMLWSAVWLFVVLNGRIYQAVSIPVWVAVCCAVLLYLTYLVKKIINGCIGEILSQ